MIGKYHTLAAVLICCLIAETVHGVRDEAQCPETQNIQAPELFSVPTLCQMDWHKAEYRMFIKWERSGGDARW